LDILTYLADRPGEVIAKQELMDHVWSDVTVEEGSIRVHVFAIRKALGDGQFGNRYIANIRGRGYSFVGTVVPLAGNAESRNRRRHEGEQDYDDGCGPARRYSVANRPAAIRLYGEQPIRASSDSEA
jgi:DNA-binding winged helix-turn-helix (wHTH) protein